MIYYNQLCVFLTHLKIVKQTNHQIFLTIITIYIYVYIVYIVSSKRDDT